MIQETISITSFDGISLNCSVKEHGSPVWIIVTHGLAEHQQRHQYFHKVFAQYFNVLTYDLRGHGQSGGATANVGDFNDYIKDLEVITNYLVQNYRMERFILFGHSMGGLITAAYLQSIYGHEVYPERVFLSAPMVAAYGALGKFFHNAPAILSQSLARITKSAALPGMINNHYLSHDDRIYQKVMADNLMHKKIHSHLLFEMIAKAREVFSKPLRATCPLYCAMGSEDRLVSFHAVKQYFTLLEKSCILKVIHGGYHELHNEVAKYREPYFEFLKSSLMDELFDKL